MGSILKTLTSQNGSEWIDEVAQAEFDLNNWIIDVGSAKLTPYLLFNGFCHKLPGHWDNAPIFDAD